MKRFLIIGFLIFFNIFSIAALDDNKLSFKITPGFSIAHGSINEYVFNARIYNIDNKESQLDWDIKAIPLLNLKADFDLVRFLHVDIQSSIGFPAQSGFMQDYDWLSTLNPTELTNYSKHNNYLAQYISFTAAIGGNIKLPAKITITPMIAYYYEFIALDGKDGYRTYKSENWETIAFSGNVISYKQEINDLLLGLALRIETIPRIFIYADFFISPAMTFLNAIDFHYVQTKSIAYWDRFTNIWQMKSQIILQYNFNTNHSIGINSSIHFIPLSKGRTAQKTIAPDGSLFPGSWSQINPQASCGGTKRFIWTLGINYSFSL